MKLLALTLLVLFLLLQIKLWSEDGGLKELWQLNRELVLQTEENQQRQERNAVLDAEVKDLKDGLAAIEERARSELGMIRKGEIFIQVVDSPIDGSNDE